MSKLINEHLEQELRSRIPSMVRNIHEGIWGAVKGAAGAIATAGKEFIKKEYRNAAHLNLERQTRLRDTMLASHYADRLGVSVQEFKRLRDLDPNEPTPPPIKIPDPNHTGPGPAPDIVNPNYKDKYELFKSAHEDWRRHKHQQAQVVGINQRDRNIGRVAERLEGKPGIPTRIGTIQSFRNRI